MQSTPRWHFRFGQYRNAIGRLETAVQIRQPSDVEVAGILQTFIFTFELAWKTMKDFLAEQGHDEKFPREVIKKAFATGMIYDGDLWIEMMERRNEMVHVYDEAIALKVAATIRSNYFEALKAAEQYLSSR